MPKNVILNMSHRLIVRQMVQVLGFEPLRATAYFTIKARSLQ
jgi:hypothetical protein